MADSNAYKQKRYRLHHKGNHTICSPMRCAFARAAKGQSDVAEQPKARTVAGESATSSQVPALEPISQQPQVSPFGEAGARLWTDMMAEGAIGPLPAILLVEACRITDRLATLDRNLKGDDWLTFRARPDGTVVVVVDRVLAEAREQAMALKGLVSEIRAAMEKKQAKVPMPAATGATKNVAHIRDELLARRAKATS